MASHESQNMTVQSSFEQSAPILEWSSEPIHIKDFSTKRRVPGFAKIVKGTYMTLGANKFSFQKQHHEVFIHSVKVGIKVLAHSLRRVETTAFFRRGNHSMFATTRLYAVDQRLAIPISYQGWFELLSEDGKSARPITSVMELARIKPEKCLVRENTKAYLIGEDGRITFNKSRVVLAGEQILVNGELTHSSLADNKMIKLLRCFDSKGDIIFLSFDQAGTFTPIASDDDFVGVFNIKDVVRRFRLPLTVKLVQGVRPKVDSSRFTGLIRLDWVYTDETAFVCPIEKNHVRLLPVPSDVNLQLVSAINEHEVKSTELYRVMINKCNRMIMNYNNTLHLIVQIPETVSKSKNRSSNVFSISLQPEKGHSSKWARSRELQLMDEVDDLYAYVRDGGETPLKSKFTYDSDDDSYWEEPAYEPLDDFRARLQALEAGERVSYHSKYRPENPRQLLDANRNGMKNESSNGKMNGSLNISPHTDSKFVQHEPPCISDVTQNLHLVSSATSALHDIGNDDITPTNKVSTTSTRQYYTTLITSVNNLGLVSSQSTTELPQNIATAHSEATQWSPIFNHTKSADVQSRKKGISVKSKLTGSRYSTSNSGSSGNEKQIYRDFKDSDICSLNKGGSSGSSDQAKTDARKKMQTLYL